MLAVAVGVDQGHSQQVVYLVRRGALTLDHSIPYYLAQCMRSRVRQSAEARRRERTLSRSIPSSGPARTRVGMARLIPSRHTGWMHLAQLNIGRLRAPMDDPIIDHFRMNLTRINSLAEVSPGFVWRLQDENGDATSIKPFDDDLEIINLTVWESIEALADFAYRSDHVELLRRRREFFEAPTQPILCLWWIAEGTIPTVEEAVFRLEHLRVYGPTPTAFTFRHRFEPFLAAPAT